MRLRLTQSGQTIEIRSTDTNTTYTVGDGGLTQKNFTTTLKNKLDGIEANATADQTAAQILTAIKTVDGSGSGLDADTLDGVNSGSFLRSDANDTLSSTLKVTGSIIHEFSSAGGYVPFPKGAMYTTATNAHTGAIRIKTPVRSVYDMVKFVVEIFDYASNESVTLNISGYINGGTNQWVNQTVVTIADSTSKDYKVRFGVSDDKATVYIGETNSTWSYPQVIVRDFYAGFNGDIDIYDDDWSIDFVTSFDSVEETYSDNLPASDWSRIKGKPSTFTPPLGSSSARGGFKIGYTESGKNYPVELSSEKMFVNVPWTDTQLTTAQVRSNFSAGSNVSITNGTISASNTDTVTSVGVSGSETTGTITLTAAGATTLTQSGQTVEIRSTDTNTTYTVGDNGLTQKNFTTTLKDKLDGIESGADVTDAVNVSAAGAMLKAGAETSTAMKGFETNLSNQDDWQNSPVSILERDQIGTGGNGADKYAPNLNFHWRSRVSNSLWMNSGGILFYGSYGSTGVPAGADGTFKTGTLYAGTESITATKVGNWNTAYTDRNKWDGGSTGLTASTGRASLGLGTAATAAATDFATAAQGTKADNAAPKDYESIADLGNPNAITGTWTTASTTDWGPPRIGSSTARWTDGTGYIQFNIPSGMKTAYLSQLTWSSGGYFYIYGIQSDGGAVLLRVVNSKNSVENTNEGDGNQHDGSTTVFAGTGLDNYSAIRITNKSGRLHLTGLGFTSSTVQGAEGMGLVHPNQLSTALSYNSLINLPTLGTAAATASTDYATASHTHAAGDITSGTLAIARIPTVDSKISEFIENKHIYQRSGSVGVYMPMVKGGLYATSASSKTGQLKIKLPSYKTAMMISFRIDVYEYNTDRQQSYIVSGYAYNDSAATWYNTSAICLSDSDNRNLIVRFYSDTTAGEQYVTIGETNSAWIYPQVVIRDVFGGYDTSIGELSGTWGISFIQDNAGTSHAAHSDNSPVVQANRVVGELTTSNIPQLAYTSLSGLPTLGTAATAATTDFATAAQGTLADSALQSETFSSSDVVLSLSGNDVTAGESITLAGGLTYNASTNTLTQADNDTVYTHPTSAGNKHIPTGGAAGQFLKYSSSGTATWATPSYTTNTDTQLTQEEVIGMLTAGTNVTISAEGVIASTDTDTVYTHPTSAGNKHIPTGGAAGQFLKYSSSGTATWATPSYTTNTDTTYSAGTGLDLTGTTFSIEPDLRDGVTRIGKDTSNYIAIGADTNVIDFHVGGVWVARMESDGDLHMKGDVIAFSDIFNP